jgi:hypothetical protein
MAAQHVSEREWVDDLVEHNCKHRRTDVINYYVALKSHRFIVLAGPRDVDKIGLAQGVAQAIVGQSSYQWSWFEAHPWWSTQTGTPGHYATVHARFNALRMDDLIGLAREGERTGLPFFVGIKHMSPAEIECYFHDLPRGLLWRPDASTVRVHLPTNLFVTGTVDADREGFAALSVDLSSPYAAVVHIEHDDPAVRDRGSDNTWSRTDWQQPFVRSRIHHGNRARAKLARILPDHLKPLAPLDVLRRCLGPIALPPAVIEKTWLYLANAFDSDGQGLFVKSIAENLAIAQDNVLVQYLLPHIVAQGEAGTEGWARVRECFALNQPRISASCIYPEYSRQKAELLSNQAGPATARSGEEDDVGR